MLKGNVFFSRHRGSTADGRKCEVCSHGPAEADRLAEGRTTSSEVHGHNANIIPRSLVNNPCFIHYPIAERGRFELPIPCGMPVFETGAFDHSATSPSDGQCDHPRRV